MNVEKRQKQQQQPKQPQHQKQYQQIQEKEQQSSTHHQQQQQHHVHCSYDKDIVCDDAQKHQQKHQHYSHQTQHMQHHHQQQQQCDQYKSTSAENIQNQQQHSHQHHQHRSKQSQQQQQQTPSHTHRHVINHQQQSQPQSQSQRKHSHSHSPHQSRHTSPHSHHSHSLHSSPHQSHQHVNNNNNNTTTDGLAKTAYQSPSHANQFSQRPSAQSTSTHAHHHHHIRRRSRRNNNNNQNSNGNGGVNGGGSGGGSGNSSFHGPHTHSHNNSQERSTLRQHSSTCSRRHRSATDISSVSLNTCHDNCVDREMQEIFVRKSCCSSSRTELAQYFAEDLYGSSRRPSSCCTSSDYCYQTDSTSLYGSRSSLSRNNSIKSASIAMRKRRALHQRQPSYTSISLRGIESARTGSQEQQLGIIKTTFDRQRSKSTDGAPRIGGGKVLLSPSEVTIERKTSKDTLSQELPDYACSPSPIRWSFLADEKIPTEMDNWKTDDTERLKTTINQQPKKPCRKSKQDHTKPKDELWPTSTSTSATATTNLTTRKRHESPFSCEFEESSTTVLFHQEGETYNNCCNNYIQCNTYLDQDLQITSEDIHQYLSKGNQNVEGDILNNSKNYPFQPSNALEFHYKNNFANNNPTTDIVPTATESIEGAESLLTTNSRASNNNNHANRNSSKETNLNQNLGDYAGSSMMRQHTNINLSTSSNLIFNNSTSGKSTIIAANENNAANEVKFINNTNYNEMQCIDFRTQDNTNMASNSFFNKPLGIDELPKEFETANTKFVTTVTNCNANDGTSSSDGQHSSPLLSPVQTGVCSFESFDAASDHNLISQRGSYQYSSPTPCSPLSPASPACSSTLSAAVNPSTSTYVLEPTHHYQNYEQDEQEQQEQQQSRHHYHHHHYHHHHHTADGFKISNAFKKVRKRARKYTDFLRKK